jgi:hypothetical protein
MGLGFVLLFWGIVIFIASAGAAVILAGLVFWIERRRGRVRKRWLAAAAVFPFLMMVYAGGAFAAYAVWCEVVRDVDPGIGDSWRVPLGNGYSLTMIDTSEQAFIRGPRGEQSHFGLTRIGSGRDVVAGEAESSFFLVNVRQHTDTSFASEADLQRQLSLQGVGQLQLMPPAEFYDQHRWGAADGLAAIAIAVPPFAALMFLVRRFARSRDGSRPIRWPASP